MDVGMHEAREREGRQKPEARRTGITQAGDPHTRTKQADGFGQPTAAFVCCMTVTPEQALSPLSTLERAVSPGAYRAKTCSGHTRPGKSPVFYIMKNKISPPGVWSPGVPFC